MTAVGYLLASYRTERAESIWRKTNIGRAIVGLVILLGWGWVAYQMGVVGIMLSAVIFAFVGMHAYFARQTNEHGLV